MKEIGDDAKIRNVFYRNLLKENGIEIPPEEDIPEYKIYLVPKHYDQRVAEALIKQGIDPTKKIDLPFDDKGLPINPDVFTWGKCYIDPVFEAVTPATKPEDVPLSPSELREIKIKKFGLPIESAQRTNANICHIIKNLEDSAVSIGVGLIPAFEGVKDACVNLGGITAEDASEICKESFNALSTSGLSPGTILKEKDGVLVPYLDEEVLPKGYVYFGDIIIHYLKIDYALKSIEEPEENHEIPEKVETVTDEEVTPAEDGVIHLENKEIKKDGCSGSCSCCCNCNPIGFPDGGDHITRD